MRPALLTQPLRAAAPDGRAERTALLGMTLFLGSWAMLFAALFFGYAMVRLRAPQWPPTDLPHLPWRTPLLATAALMGSGLLVRRARAPGRSTKGMGGALVAAAVGGATFLVAQAWVWRGVYGRGLKPESGAYGAVFYAFTGFHALHVVVGIAAWIALGGRALLVAQPARLGLRLWGLYWDLVAVVWLIMFLTVYVL